MMQPDAEGQPGHGSAPSEVSPFYIPSVASTRGRRARTLKNHDTFVVLDTFGDAQAERPGPEGLFHQDTRFLAQFVLLINGERPLLLSSTVTTDNEMLATDLTNPDFYDGDRLVLARDMLHLRRRKVLAAGGCFEVFEIKSYADHDVAVVLAFRFAADFVDIFEVRGKHRERRGQLLEPEIGQDTVALAYRGLDDVVRRSQLRFTPAPDRLRPREARFDVRLPPGGSRTLEVALRCEINGSATAEPPSFGQAVGATARVLERRRAQAVKISTSSQSFDAWIDRSRADLDMLVTDKPTGPFPYAGIPWFSTPFGRDGIITALQVLWLAPELARGVLGFLAAHQAKALSPEMDAEPGKILHETRKGEMAALGEVPFGCYYGSVDSTPLFVMLAAAYHERTADLAFIREIWPNIEAAIGWMDAYGDLDRDGFIEYDRRSATGLVNQGWKDSNDSVFHADGRLAEPPIALIEVQGYAYAAWDGAARLAQALGDTGRHEAWRQRAARLRRKVDTAFWCEEIGTYALALDGDKRQCRVRTSNAGHALFTGVATPGRAARVAATLMDGSSFSDWGIRTVPATEARYNPMSYHNGSVWPHDNGLIAMGFARYGLREPLLKILGGLYEAAGGFELHRLPELFCGFSRRAGEGPTAYPVACSPQAWASATVFALLGAALGASFDIGERQIRFTRPLLPRFLEEVRLAQLRLGDSAVDLLFRRHTRDVSLNVLRKTGEAEIVLISG